MNLLCAKCGGECCKYIILPLHLDGGADVSWLMARGTLTGCDANGTSQWRIKSRCPQLNAAGRCRVYARRPKSCEHFAVDGEACRKAREMGGKP